MEKLYPSYTIGETDNVAFLNIYGPGAISYYFMFDKATNLSNEKCKLK